MCSEHMKALHTSRFISLLLKWNIVWFKINLTFVTNGTVQWIYLKIFINHDILGGCGERGIRIDAQILKWEPFMDSQSMSNSKFRRRFNIEWTKFWRQKSVEKHKNISMLFWHWINVKNAPLVKPMARPMGLLVTIDICTTWLSCTDILIIDCSVCIAIYDNIMVQKKIQFLQQGSIVFTCV